MTIRFFRIIRAEECLIHLRTGSEEGSQRLGYRQIDALVTGPCIALPQSVFEVQKVHTHGAGELLSEERHCVGGIECEGNSVFK